MTAENPVPEARRPEAAQARRPEATQAEGHAEGRKHPGFFRTAKDLFMGVTRPIRWLGRQTWKRVTGVTSGVWEATGGQVTGELGEAARRAGFEGVSREVGPLHKLASIIEDTANRVGKVVGGIIDYTVGIPGRVVGRALRGTQNTGTGAAAGETHAKTTRGEEEVAARAAGAHGAH